MKIIDHPLDTTRIHLDGFYSILDTKQKYTANRPIIFKAEKIIFIGNRTADGNNPLTCEYYKDRNLNQYGVNEEVDYKHGKYTIIGDSIYAYSPANFFVAEPLARVVRTYMAHFSGYIKNKDTITDWKMIKPYPEKIGPYEVDENKHLFKPKTYYFVKTDAVQCLNVEKFQ